MKVLGIDEAGRGPAVGPMIMAGVLYDEKMDEALTKMGIRDSKRLTSKRRESLEMRIKENVERYWIVEIPVSLIDRKNLNTLEIESTASIINEADADRVFLDAPVAGSGIDKYIKKLREIVRKETAITAENHADDIYPCVSTASILAKVERDRIIKKLQERYGDFGSGYPGDDKTRKFIPEWHKFPDIVRKRWSPVREAMVRKGRIMILGEKDTGKTELARQLVNIGIDKGMEVGVLDLDPGQSHIGKPGTLGFGIACRKIRRLEQITPLVAYSIFSLSPNGCEERILQGIEWMMERIPQVDLLIVDTSGYTKNMDFKKEKIRLINPDSVVFLERKKELKYLKKGLESRIYPVPVYEDVRKKSDRKRKAFRKKVVR
ncbi:MAG: ribonuclease HII [candidate division WOR-3 bacterium]|nr:ribonuclease HII [candidate division WOR-3 bacterium]